MLTKFALISELLTIDHGKYVVRVMVMNQEEKAIASGLAAAETIEVAEDRARERALTLINNEVNANFSNSLSFSSTQSSTPPETPDQLESPEIYSHHQTTVKQNITSSNQVTSVKSSKSPKKNQGKSSSTQTSEKLEELPLIEENQALLTPDTASNLESSAEFSLTSADLEINDNFNASEEKEVSSETKTNLPSSSGDQSISWDIISRTNIELKRLGWTQEQGRNYLLETYGKKSRHLLTDEELIEFCHYLESQP